jgi:oxygen-dependent protoporphyrinogen oxidase
MRIVVAGAGLSGLSLCHALQEKLEAAGKQAEILLIESEGRAGGKVRTHRESGYVMEWGPNGFLNNKPDTLELCRKLGIDNKLLPSNDAARRRFIYADGRLHNISPPKLIMGDLLSWPSKFRLLGEYFVPKYTGSTDETLADFARRRLGHQALERLIGPMASGVFGGDPETMSLKSCFPAIYNLEQTYGGLFRGLLAKRAEKKKKGIKDNAGPAGPGGVLTSFEGGLDVLTEALRSSFKGRLLLSSPVKNVNASGGKFQISAGDEVIEAEIFVTASPAYAAAEFLTPIDPSVPEILNQIQYAPMSVVGLGFDKEGIGHDLNGFGFLVGMKENRKLIGTLWDSSVFSGRAPEGKCSLRSMTGGGRDLKTPFLPDDELADAVVSELRLIMGIKGDPELVKIFRHEKAIPMYTIGHSVRLEWLDRIEKKNPGLFFAGNAFRGVGLNDCVREAYAVAEKVMGRV